MARKQRVSTVEQAERDARWAAIKTAIDAREQAWQQELAQRVVGLMDAKTTSAA